MCDETMFCPKCGVLNASNASFCASCGQLLSDSIQEPVREDKSGVSLEFTGELRRFSHESGVSKVAFSSNGHSILSAGLDIIMWDIETGSQLRRLGSGSVWAPVAFSPDGRLAVSADKDERLHLWDVEAAKEILRFKGDPHTNTPRERDRIRVNWVAFSPNGRLIVSSSGEIPGLRLWDVQSGQELRRTNGKYWFSTGLMPVISSVEFSPDSRLVVSNDSTVFGGDDIHIWDLESGREIHKFVWGKNHKESIRISSLVFSPDGKFILFGAPEDKSVRLWHVESGCEIQCFKGHTDSISTLDPEEYILGRISVAFSPNGIHAISGGDDGVVIIWDTKTGAEICRFRGHSEPVSSVAFSSDGRLAVSGSDDKTVRLWKLPMNQ